jgi:MMPL family
VVLLIGFGAVVAALLPLGLATMAILAAPGLMAFVSHIAGATEESSALMLLIGLAVGVDYSMFYVKRQREERAGGRPVLDAIEVAAATSGRSVLISGLTVLVAISGLFLTGNKVFYGMAEATMLVVACAVIGSLTLLPALLAVLGDRVDRGQLPVISRLHRPAGQSRIRTAILDRSLARPALTAGISACALVALAVPVLRLHTAQLGVTDLPQDTAALQTYDRIQQVFPGGPAPAVVVVEAPDVTSPAMVAASRAFEQAALATGQMKQPITVIVNPAHTAAIIQVPLAGTGEDTTSVHALATLRDRSSRPRSARYPASRSRSPGTVVMVPACSRGGAARSPKAAARTRSGRSGPAEVRGSGRSCRPAVRRRPRRARRPGRSAAAARRRRPAGLRHRGGRSARRAGRRRTKPARIATSSGLNAVPTTRTTTCPAPATKQA